MIAGIIFGIMFLAIVYLIADNLILTYKNKFYEGVLMNNKDKFSPDRYIQIERKMRSKTCLTLKEMFHAND